MAIRLADHVAADGMFIRESGRTDDAGRRVASKRFVVRKSRFQFNARQGLSIVQLRQAVFEDCDFSYTGYIDDAAGIGKYGGHSPTAGVDVEPNNTLAHGDRMNVLTGEILFKNCRIIGNYGAAFLASKFAHGEHFLERVSIEGCSLECGEGESGGRDGFIFDVPEGVVVGNTLQMADKTAYLGWHPEGHASFQFAENRVLGRNPKDHRYILVTRNTRGTPLIEGNQVIGQHRTPKQIRASLLVLLENRNAIVRGNYFFLPKEAHPSTEHREPMPAIRSHSAVMKGNSYDTDLVPNGRAEGPSFSIIYSASSNVSEERFPPEDKQGTRPIRPVRLPA